MKNMKKLLSLLLVLTMVFSLAVPVFAEEDSAAPVTATLVTDYAALATGDQVVLVNKEYNLAMDTFKTAATHYNAGVAVTPAEGKLTDVAESLIWTLTKNDDGTWYIAQGSNKLSMGTQYSSMPANDVNDKWTISANANGTCYIQNVGRSAYIQWYAKNNYYSGFQYLNAGNEKYFELNLYKIDSMDPTPAGDLAGKTVILHTNDIHGMTSTLNAKGGFDTAGSLDGYSYIAAVKADYEARGAEVILVDAGDFTQGSSYVSVSEGASAITMMNAVGYDVATLGNHEFDYGYTRLAENLKDADFEVVCCNVLNEDGTPITAAYTTVTADNGVKVGFIGVNTPETQTKAHPAKIAGLSWLAQDAMVEAVQTAADALKGEADVIVVLSHLGVDGESAPNRSYDLWNGLTEGSVDFIIDGHSHTTMTKGVNDEPIQSTGTASQNIGVIVIDNATKAIESNELVPIYKTKESTPKADETVAAVAKGIYEEVDAAMAVVIGKTEVELNGIKGTYDPATGDYVAGNRNSETNLGDLATDAMLWLIKEQYLADLNGIDADNVIALTNGGGIRTTIKAGDITRGNVKDVFPFSNIVSVIYVTGEQLLEALEAATYCSPNPVGAFPQVAGMEYAINLAYEFDEGDLYDGSTYHKPASIQRITIDNINGKDFDPNATYAVVTNDFTAAGGDTYSVFKEASAFISTGVPLEDALAAYIKEELGGVVTAEAYGEPQGRIFYEDEEVYNSEFTDVAEDQWFYAPVTALAETGIIKGYENADGTYSFHPDETLTREQFITMLYRIVEEEVEVNAAALSAFTDADIIGYGKDAVAWGVESGIISGYKEADGTYTFRPNQSITRAEMAKMICCFIEYLAEESAPDELKESAGFVDVTNQWFAPYVNVLANLGIVSGIDTVPHFAPDATATRAEAAQIIVNMVLALAGSVEGTALAELAA